MEDQITKLAASLQELLPDGTNAMEITVPRRATRLLLVNYGTRQGGHTTIEITETTRRMDDLPGMPDNEFEDFYAHPDDRPSIATMSFGCFSADGDPVAMPLGQTNHLDRTEESVTNIDDAGNLIGYDDALQDRLIERAIENFQRYRKMGFFGSAAIRTPRHDFTTDLRRIYAEITVEHRMYIELEQLRRKQLQEQMDFLEKADRERRQREQS